MFSLILSITRTQITFYLVPMWPNVYDVIGIKLSVCVNFTIFTILFRLHHLLTNIWCVHVNRTNMLRKFDRQMVVNGKPFSSIGRWWYTKVNSKFPFISRWIYICNYLHFCIRVIIHVFNNSWNDPVQELHDLRSYLEYPMNWMCWFVFRFQPSGL